MKLGDLRGAIRKPGNPTMVVDLGNGVPMTVAFQKTPLLEELGKAFNDERTAETGLSYDPVTNLLTVDGHAGPTSIAGALVDEDDEPETSSVNFTGDDLEQEDDEPMSPEEISDLDDDDEDDEDDLL